MTAGARGLLLFEHCNIYLETLKAYENQPKALAAKESNHRVIKTNILLYRIARRVEGNKG